MNENWKRPQTAADVCFGVHDSETFGRNIRDWQHELQKIPHKQELKRRMLDEPPLLSDVLKDDGQSDAYLAAYVEWLCDRIGIDSPDWVNQSERYARKPWYDLPSLWKDSFIQAPGSFRARGVFTIPENVVSLRPGRTRTSAESKRRKNAQRQKRHRLRIQEKLQRLEDLERGGLI